MKSKIVFSIVNVLVLCVIIASVSALFLTNQLLTGIVLVGLGFLCLASLSLFRVKVRSVGPDIIFGVIDNGILVIMALVGGEIAGVLGAVIGGVVGNAITDGIAGVFEGFFAERLRKNHINETRTVLSSSVGKMAGCLLGGGFILFVASFI